MAISIFSVAHSAVVGGGDIHRRRWPFEFWGSIFKCYLDWS